MSAFGKQNLNVQNIKIGREKQFMMDDSTERELIDGSTEIDIKRNKGKGYGTNKKQKGKFSKRVFGATGGPSENDDEESSYSNSNSEDLDVRDRKGKNNETYEQYT